MLSHLDFHVEYPADMTQRDLFALWEEEAKAALGAKEAGAVVDLWKCVGQRRIIAVVNVESPDTLDQILFYVAHREGDGAARAGRRDAAATLRGLHRRRQRVARRGGVARRSRRGGAHPAISRFSGSRIARTMRTVWTTISAYSARAAPRELWSANDSDACWLPTEGGNAG